MKKHYTKLLVGAGTTLAIIIGIAVYHKQKSVPADKAYEYTSPLNAKQREKIQDIFLSQKSSRNARTALGIEKNISNIKTIALKLSDSNISLKNKRNLIESLDSHKYELSILKNEYMKETGVGAPETGETGQRIDKLINEIDVVYHSYAKKNQTKFETSLNRINNYLKSTSEVREPTNYHATPVRKMPRQASPPKAEKEASSKVIKFMVFALKWLSPINIAQAAEAMTCDEKFFPEPENPKAVGSEYLSLSLPENELSPEMTALVNKLKTPIELFRYVRNEVKYKQYDGVMQNARSAYLSGNGNGPDKANLLLTLLRKAGYPARYVIGQVLVSEEQLKKIWQLEDTLSVWNYHSGQYPFLEYYYNKARWVNLNGKSYFIMPHIWVETFIPFDEKRGVGLQSSTSSWIPLDPAFDYNDVLSRWYQMSQVVGMAETTNKPLFDAVSYLTVADPLTGKVLKNKSPDEVLTENIVSILNLGLSQSKDWGIPLSEFKKHSEKISNRSEILYIGPSGAEACILKKVAILPEDRKIKSKIEYVGISHTFNAVDASLKDINIIFRGVTSADETKLNQVSAGTLTSTDGINVVPELYIGDSKVATGTPSAFGADAELVSTIYVPIESSYDFSTGKYYSKTSYQPVGKIISVVYNFQQASQKFIDERIEVLSEGLNLSDFSNKSYIEKSRITAQVLTVTGMLALNQNSIVTNTIRGLTNTRSQSSIDTIIMNSGVKPIIVFDRILGFVPEKPSIDWTGSEDYFPRISYFPITDSRYNEHKELLIANDIRGIASSSIEHKIFEDFFSIPGQSTVKVIQIAKDINMPVYIRNVNTSNINSAFTGVTQPTSWYESRILESNSLPGKIIIPQSAVTVAGNSYRSMYYISDDKTYYMALIGGYNGGWGGTPAPESKTGNTINLVSQDAESLTDYFGVSENADGWMDAIFDGDLDIADFLLAGSPFGGCASVGQPVNINNGGMWHIFNDIPRINTSGVPLEFYRIYQSQSKHNGTLGYGWSHNYNVRLETKNGEAYDMGENQDLLFYDENNNPTLFAYVNGDYISPPGAKLRFMKSIKYAGFINIIDSNQKVYRFDEIVTGFLKISSIKDRNGNTLTFNYTSGNLIQIRDSLNRNIQLSYYPDGKLQRATDFTGRYVEYSYDTRGDLISSKDLRGKSTSYSYLFNQVNPDLNHNLASFRDPENNGVDYFYYANDKVFKHIEAQGKLTLFMYNPYSQETHVIDSFNNKTTYQYDSFGNITKIINPDGTFVAQKWDIFGNKTEVQDEEGFKTTYMSDDRGNIIQIIPPAPYGKTEITYNETFNIPLSIKDGNNNIKNFIIDEANGNILSETVYKGQNQTLPLTTSFTYQSDGQIASITNPKGDTTAFARVIDEHFNETTITTNNNNDISSQIKDAAGNTVETIDFNGVKTTRVFDELNNLLSTETIGSGIRKEFDYDDSSNLIAEKTIGSGKTLANEFSYDGLKNRISSKNALGEITKYKYALPGCGCKSESVLQSVTDAKGNETNFSHNWKGKVTEIRNSRGSLTKIEYDGRGNQSLIRTFDKFGKQLSESRFTYDALGKLKSAIENVPTTFEPLVKQYYVGRVPQSIPTTTKYTYDKVGNLLQKKMDRGYYPLTERIDYVYTPNYLLASKSLVSELHSYNELYQYDNNTNVTRIQNKDSVLEFEYDNLNRISKVKTINDASLGIRQPSTELVYTYLKNGQVNAVTEGQNVIAYSFDGVNRLTGVSALNQNFQFTYDQMGRRNKIQYPNGIVNNISYDDGSRVTSIASGVAGNMDLTYDKNGNVRGIRSDRGQWEYGYDESNWLIHSYYQGSAPIANENLTWDAAGNKISGGDAGIKHTASASALRSRPLIMDNYLLEDAEPLNDQYGSGRNAYKYDFKGNIEEKYDNLADHHWYYEYDAENKLRVVKKLGVGNVLISKTSYRYDGLGRRIEKEVQYGDGSVKRSGYVYDRENILNEYNSNGQKVATYIGTGEMDSNLMMVRDGSPYFYHTDHLGSITSITDSMGKVVQKVTYKSFGEIAEVRDNNDVRTIASVGVISNPYYFTGREWDEDAGLYYYRARYYDPNTGRFISKDPIGYAAGDANLYRYVMNNPVNAVDPTGLKLWYGDSASEAEYKDDIRLIMQTSAGRELLSQLHNSNQTYYINMVNDGRLEADISARTVFIDPNINPTIMTNAGMQNASTTRILAHELGHLTGLTDSGPDQMDNVNRWENPIMEPLEGYNRTQYGFPSGPSNYSGADDCR